MYLRFLVFFIPLCRCIFPSGIIFLLPERRQLTLLIVKFWSADDKVFQFLYVWKAFISLCFRRIIFMLTALILQNFKVLFHCLLAYLFSKEEFALMCFCSKFFVPVLALYSKHKSRFPLPLFCTFTVTSNSPVQPVLKSHAFSPLSPSRISPCLSLAQPAPAPALLP